MNTRRDFLRKGAFAGLGMLTMSELAKAVVSKQNGNVSPKIKLEKDSVILFQGDSITDMFRKYDCNQCNTPEQMGMGYALFAASTLLSDYPDKQLKIYNRGVGGNKVYQLRDRWELDTLAIQPDVLSILIGVNDFWHILMGNYKGSLGIYERDLQDLLHYTKEKLPNVQLVLGEPFALRGGSAIDDAKWFPEFDGYRASLKKLADEFNAIFVPYQAAFDAALKLAPARYWGADGVHPDLPGRQLMANVWLEATGLKSKVGRSEIIYLFLLEVRGCLIVVREASILLSYNENE